MAFFFCYFLHFQKYLFYNHFVRIKISSHFFFFLFSLNNYLTWKCASGRTQLYNKYTTNLFFFFFVSVFHSLERSQCALPYLLNKSVECFITEKKFNATKIKPHTHWKAFNKQSQVTGHRKYLLFFFFFFQECLSGRGINHFTFFLLWKYVHHAIEVLTCWRSNSFELLILSLFSCFSSVLV